MPFIEIFRGLGAHAFLSRSPAADAKGILSSLERLGAPRVIILPNGPVDPALAEEIAGAGREALVVPTRTIAQGVAAAIALRHAEGLERNAALMRSAMEAVRTLEISWDTAAGDGSAEPVSASRDGRQAGTFDTPVHALEALMSGADVTASEIVTLYVGRGVGPERNGSCARA